MPGYLSILGSYFLKPFTWPGTPFLHGGAHSRGEKPIYPMRNPILGYETHSPHEKPISGPGTPFTH